MLKRDKSPYVKSRRTMNGEIKKDVCNGRASGSNAWRINGLCLQDYPGTE